MYFTVFMLSCALIPFYPDYGNAFRFSVKRLLYLCACAIIYMVLHAVLYPVLFRKVILVLVPLIPASFADIRCREIPDLAYAPMLIYCFLHAHYIYYTACIALFLFLLIPALKRMIGFGDIKVLMILTAITGQMICFILMCASGICLLAHCRKGSAVQIPFLPYIASGYALYLLFF